MAKAMCGGLVPSGAVLMTDSIYGSVWGSLKRSPIHTSTFSENGRAMRVGTAVLDSLHKEEAGIHSAVCFRVQGLFARISAGCSLLVISRRLSAQAEP
jgi:acetylornithine/succinyldiaminopimelate/putrescine aminotransferase